MDSLASVATTRWLRRYTRRPAAGLRLVCLPHGGGTAAAYRGWASDLPEWIELTAVEYPGRADRFTEPAYTDMTKLVEAVTGALMPLTDRPYVLFGHSMGAAIAYETALLLARRGAALPIRLIVSGREAPQHSHPLPAGLDREDALITELTRVGGTELKLLENPEMRALLLARLAADCELIATYRPAPAREPLHCPVSAMVGDQDPLVTIEEAAGWAAATSGPFDLTVFPGDHFYLVPQKHALLDALIQRVLAD
jgi:pyochelin biosynthesis protein PchC